jgi:hypothetical protein
LKFGIQDYLLLTELNKKIKREKIEEILKCLLGDLNKMNSSKEITRIDYSENIEDLSKIRNLIFDCLQGK